MKERFRPFEYVDDETGKKVKTKLHERLEYNFWLRFISNHYNPCPKCQNQIDGFFKEGFVLSQTPITFSYDISKNNPEKLAYQFTFPWTFEHFEPCVECQKQISEKMEDAQISLDYEKPLVVLRRSWELVDP